MENRKNTVVLVSAIFGALFVIGHLIFWIWAGSSSGLVNVGFFEGIRNLISSIREDALFRQDILIILVLILLGIFSLSSLIVNVMAWLKNSSKLTLISGILHLLSFNIFAAPLCFVEFADNKSKIKDKLFFYVIPYTAIISILFSILFFVAGEMTGFAIYFTITSVLGILTNISAWQKETRWLKVASGTFYLLSGLNIISAIFSFIYTKKNKDEIKDKLFFHVLECTVIFNIVLFIIFFFTTLTDMSGGTDTGTVGAFIYIMLTAAIGILFNILAWKNGAKWMKIVSGIFYILSIFNIISAIFSFIYCRQNKKA